MSLFKQLGGSSFSLQINKAKIFQRSPFNTEQIFMTFCFVTICFNHTVICSDFVVLHSKFRLFRFEFVSSVKLYGPLSKVFQLQLFQRNKLIIISKRNNLFNNFYSDIMLVVSLLKEGMFGHKNDLVCSKKIQL
jgi:hypothetical protein